MTIINQLKNKIKLTEGQILYYSLMSVILIAVVLILLYPITSKGNYFQIISGSLIILLASLVFGMFFGFIFAVPKSKNKNSENKDENGKYNSKYDSNANLEDISDWLTKIIVGVGLTQLGQIDPALSKLSTYLSQSIGVTNVNDITKNDSGYVYALILYGVISGFIFSYVVTRIYFPNLFFNLPDQLTLPKMQAQLNNLEENVKHTVDTIKEKVDEKLLIGTMYTDLYRPGGFEKVITDATRFLIQNPEPTSAHFWIYLSCAYGQKFKKDPTNDGLKIKALEAAKKAIETNKEFAIKLLRQLWDPNLHQNSVDNDLEVFYDDPEFKTLLG